MMLDKVLISNTRQQRAYTVAEYVRLKSPGNATLDM